MGSQELAMPVLTTISLLCFCFIAKSGAKTYIIETEDGDEVTPQWRVHSGELREMVPDSEYGEDYGGYETKPHEWTTKEHKWTTTPAQETWTTKEHKWTTTTPAHENWTKKEHKWTTTTSHPYHGKVKNEIVDFAVEKLKEKGELKNLYNNCGKDFRTVTDWFELEVNGIIYTFEVDCPTNHKGRQEIIKYKCEVKVHNGPTKNELTMGRCEGRKRGN